MSLKSTLSFIINHPLNKGRRLGALLKFANWQIKNRINPGRITFPYGEKSMLIAEKGMTGATGNLYCGLHEFEDMSFVLHFLRPSDLFIDIGANIGSYTILASSERDARTISIEPEPATYGVLNENIALNNVAAKVTALNIALGKEDGQLQFTKSLDTVNHVAVAADNGSELISVTVKALDNVVQVTSPALIKMDVEGFETEVMNGMPHVLENHLLKALIIELNGSGKRYGYDENAIHNKLLSHGFAPYAYRPFERKLEKLRIYKGNDNTIYIRDIAFVSERVTEAKPYKINLSTV